jgi:hypothetical protein
MGEGGGGIGVGVGSHDGRWDEQGDGGEEQQSGLHAGSDPVELLGVELETAKEKGRAEHEQRVGDNGAGNGSLHQHVFPGTQGGQCDDQFRQVAKCGVEQTAHRIACFRRDRLRGVAEQRR